MLYFYDLPVYRLPRDVYEADRDEFIRCHVRASADPNSDADVLVRDHLLQKYGGCWLFNEIIEHIRFHFCGSQIRGEYFAVSKKRVVRTRTKTFEYQRWKLVPEVEIAAPQGANEILATIRGYIKNCQCKREFRRRLIDSSLFEVAAPYIDWATLYGRSSPRGRSPHQ